MLGKQMHNSICDLTRFYNILCNDCTHVTDHICNQENPKGSNDVVSSLYKPTGHPENPSPVFLVT